MNKKTLVMYAVIGGGIYYLINKAKKATEAMAAVRAAQLSAARAPFTQAPTDSLMPATMQGALLGKIDDVHRQRKLHRKLQVIGAPQHVRILR